MKVAIVVSQFNREVTDGLKNGAIHLLTEMGLTKEQIELFEAPGAFEIPLIAQALAHTKRFSGIICLGCVIKGDTAHFEFISLGATLGIQQASLQAQIPITFGVLTTYTDEQARVRSLPDANNKGREAALACLEALETLKTIRQPRA